MRVLFLALRWCGLGLVFAWFVSAAMTTGARAMFPEEPADVFRTRALASVENEVVPASTLVANDARRRARARESAVAVILEHNPFCAECPASSSSAAPSPEVSPDSQANEAAVASVRLLATMEAEDPHDSLATIYDPQRGSRPAGIGDALAPGVVVVGVGPGHLDFRTSTSAGTLRIVPLGQPEPPPRRAAQYDERPKRHDPLADRIQCEPGAPCRVERSLIRDAIATPSVLGGLRAVPAAAGFKLGGVRRGSLAHQLGLRNGDVLTAVGGKPLRSIDDALSLLPLLRSASSIEVELSRKGKTMTHAIEIV